jgi:hypothetical protein
MMEDSGFRVRDSVSKLRGSRVISCVFPAILLVTICCLLSTAFCADNPMDRMRDETLSYFKPLVGKVSKVEGKEIVLDLGRKDSIRKGMRFQILREGAVFLHPVTKEPLGKLETLVGKLEIKEVDAASSVGEIIEGEAKEGDKVGISEIKVNVLFCQSKNTEWHLSDSYYGTLKKTGRFNLIDTSLNTDDPSKAIAEAKRLRADVALLLVEKKVNSGAVLTQRLFWVPDGVQFSETSATIDAAFSRELNAGEAFFETAETGAQQQFDVPFNAKFLSVCDLDGKGKKDVVLATTNDVRVYTLKGGLQPAFGGIGITGAAVDNPIWLDCVDVNKNGRDEVIVTTMKSVSKAGDPEQISKNQGDSDVVSYIYELNGSDFVLLYKDHAFLRKLDSGLIAQGYSAAEGFSGDVYKVIWDGKYEHGESLRLPKGVNIYDFLYFGGPASDRLLIAYDNYGFLNVYDSENRRLWRSKTDTGGFLTSFEKKARDTLVDNKGEWSVKDRLSLKNGLILVVDRIPLVSMIKSLGFQKSRIKSLLWNGLSMEENVLVDNIKSTLVDYAVSGDEIMVLASPLFGIKAGNILKGESPLKTELYIYSSGGM